MHQKVITNVIPEPIPYNIKIFYKINTKNNLILFNTHSSSQFIRRKNTNYALMGQAQYEVIYIGLLK
jgi:hypothetical protein